MAVEPTGLSPVSDPTSSPVDADLGSGSHGVYGFSSYVSRKQRREVETQEIQVRTTLRRRKVVARGGVLMGFGLAMIVYPVMGNVVSYADAVEQVPGVVVGETPTTGHALLGDGPTLVAADLPLPSVDDTALMMATSNKYQVSNLLPDCLPSSSYSSDNGRLPASELCLLWNGSVYVRADAALALAQLNEQFKVQFGRDLCVGSGYRTYDEQVTTKRNRGYLAAAPGTSMHGYGVAVDLCGDDDKGSAFTWLNNNAATFGFENPYWAKTRKYEPWHWEYYPATAEHYNSYSTWSADGENDSGTSSTTPAETVAPAQPAPVVTPAPAVSEKPAEPDTAAAH